jgi:excisionase family DNA binding protein
MPMAIQMESKTLTLTQAAAYIGVKKRTLYNMLNDGRFPVDSIPHTKPRRWSVDAVDSWVAGGAE